MVVEQPSEVERVAGFGPITEHDRDGGQHLNVHGVAGAIREPRVTGVEPPGPLAVRAAILAANGYEDGARNDARLVSAKPLLPEERALIVPLLE